MRYIVIIGSSLLCVTLLSGCMMMSMGSGKSHSSGGMKCGMKMGGMKTDHSAKEMDHEMNGQEMPTHSKSYVITERYCTQCHDMREAEAYSPSQWKPILSRMMGYMKKADKLQPDTYEQVMIEHYYGIEEK